jgi:hypothetical protein
VLQFASRVRSLGLDEKDLASAERRATATLVIRREDVAGWIELHRGGAGRILGPLRSQPGAESNERWPDVVAEIPVEIAPPEEPRDAAALESALAEIDAIARLLRTAEGRARVHRLREAVLKAATGALAGPVLMILAG